MVTKEQIRDIRVKLGDLAFTVDKMKRLCDVALFEYQVAGQSKSLPEADVTALVEEYKDLKTELKTKLSALP